MDASKNSHVKDQNVIREMVWYEGTDAIYEGEAVSYLIATGTATAVDGKRSAHVNRPTTSTNRAFAGVAARNYPANSGGQFIEINCPGSKSVSIALGADTVLNTGILTFTAGSGTAGGRFVKGGYEGRGSAYVRQTVTALIESSMTGGWSLATDGVTLTVTATAGLSAGDTVVLLAGEAEDGGGNIVAGKYTISSITSATVLVLTSTAINGTAGSALTATGYAYTGNPTAQADLLTGEESGGVEFISLPNAGGDSQSYMTGGVSYVAGGVTLAADAEVELADGTLYGERKGFVCLGTLTTSDFVVDLVTAALQLDGATALAEVNAIDAAADAVFLEWNGVWQIKGLVGGATQA